MNANREDRMTSRHGVAHAALAAAILSTIALAPAPRSGPADPTPMVVHEWGTFTSIAGVDGQPVEWSPLGDQSDLPCFVDRFRWEEKLRLAGTVRMETPVIYFYAPRNVSVNVRVRFHQGVITEWFPRAAVTPARVTSAHLRAPSFVGSATWNDLTIAPFDEENFPTEPTASHYYAARQTDAAPVRAGSQREKFLFYRGVGRFPLPLTAIVDDEGGIDVKPSATVDRDGNGAVGTVMFFENRGGTITYDIRRAARGHVRFEPDLHRAATIDVASDLEEMLIAEGLYAKEAHAMVETWRDAWFEEGARLIYIVPQRTVDAVLPLEIAPKPVEQARVFVGRMELITPRMRAAVSTALTDSDVTTLTRYGRFVRAMAAQVLASGMSVAERMRVDALLAAAERRSTRTGAACAATDPRVSRSSK
jgi:hypothetical protein